MGGVFSNTVIYSERTALYKVLKVSLIYALLLVLPHAFFSLLSGPNIYIRNGLGCVKVRILSS